MRTKKYKYLLFIAGLCFLSLWEKNAAGQEVIQIEDTACENLKQDETLSTARVRAIDAASFGAVSKLPALLQYKKNLDSHDFNVMVYGIVDNYLEDLSAETIEQTAEKICVRIKGYVRSQKISQGIDESFNRQSKEEVLVDETADKAADLSAAVTEELSKAAKEQKQAQINELKNKKVVYKEQTTEKQEPKLSSLTDNNIKPEISPQKLSEKNKDLKKGLIYVEPALFYNQSQSNYYADIIRNWFSDQADFLVTENPQMADFILRPKILRAKVENINDDSSRLQMVTALELVYTESGKSYTEHQNRFVVYTSEEGEQEVAFKLMKKLFEESCESLSVGMKKKVEEKKQINLEDKKTALPSVITPVKISYSNEDAEQ